MLDSNSVYITLVIIVAILIIPTIIFGKLLIEKYFKYNKSNKDMIVQSIENKDIKLEELINKAEENIDKRKRDEKSADLGICPNCLSTDNLKVIYSCENTGEDEYRCKSCNWTGYGEMI